MGRKATDIIKNMTTFPSIVQTKYLIGSTKQLLLLSLLFKRLWSPGIDSKE
jgi:hypothetical protein